MFFRTDYGGSDRTMITLTHWHITRYIPIIYGSGYTTLGEMRLVEFYGAHHAAILLVLGGPC